MKRVGIIGAGKIATHLAARLRSKEHEVCFLLGRSMVQRPLNQVLEEVNPDAVFLAISTRDTGEAARDYILACLDAGVPVITCEKGALAYHAELLKPHINCIGYSASVGGGTMLLRYLQGRHLTDEPVEIHAVLNGSLNFIFDALGRGRSLGEACEEARRLEIIEPGATDPLAIINGELKDVSMKACVLFNTSLVREQCISPDQFVPPVLTEEDLRELSEEEPGYRLLIHFSNQSPMKDPDLEKHVWSSEINRWHITGAFRRSASSWVPRGKGNAIHIIEGRLGGGGIYTLSGPGAGLEPTTSAMLADFKELCR